MVALVSSIFPDRRFFSWTSAREVGPYRWFSVARTRTTHVMAPLPNSRWMKPPYFSISTNSEPRQHGRPRLPLKTFSGSRISPKSLSFLSDFSPSLYREMLRKHAVGTICCAAWSLVVNGDAIFFVVTNWSR